MDFLDNINRIERLDQLIRLKKTGTPTELANRLEVSERHIYRLIDLMRKMGANIKYSKDRNTYYFVTTQELRLGYNH